MNRQSVITSDWDTLRALQQMHTDTQEMQYSPTQILGRETQDKSVIRAPGANTF